MRCGGERAIGCVGDTDGMEIEPDGTTAADGLPPGHREARLEAVIAIGVVMGLQATLAVVSLGNGWLLWGQAGWLWLIFIVPELLLLGTLTLHIRRHGAERPERRRRLSLALVGFIVLVNLVTLVILIGSLLTSQEKQGGELLFKAVTIWSTNVVAFGLLFWEIDAGGPIARLRAPERAHDFQFPQLENPQLAAPGWRPRLTDYVYVSFTNSIAFSPTDAMPLTTKAKGFMALESAISATTVLLAAARAVNILH